MSWLVEEGIGERRAILHDSGGIPIAAKLDWPGCLAPGQVEDAVLVAKPKGSSRGRARFASGEEALVDRLPRDAAEGAPIRLEVTRSAMGEAGRVKLAQARPTQEDPRFAPSLLKILPDAKLVQRLPDGEWQDIWQQAWDGLVLFPGGLLHFAPTPAMTLIDIDGLLPPRELALAAVAPLARAAALLDLGGSIGIDFPTLQDKADRKAVDVALSQALTFDHERTAMNGFGFVQIVSRLERPSLLHRLAHDRAGAAARMLLRRAEAVRDPGALLLTCPPQVEARLRVEWLAELARRTGREVRVEVRSGLAPEGAFAQAVPR